jgi:hypothetical protein
MTRRDLADDARQSRPVRPPITAAEPVPAATTLDGIGIEPSPTSNRPLAQITSSTTVRLVSRERCPGLRRQFRVGAGNGLLPRERHQVGKGSLDPGSAARVISTGATCLFVVGDRGEAKSTRCVVASIRRVHGARLTGRERGGSQESPDGAARPRAAAPPGPQMPAQHAPALDRPARGPARGSSRPCSALHGSIRKSASASPTAEPRGGRCASPVRVASPNRVIGMSSVCVVPETGLMSCGELSADDAWRTARRYGWRQL